MDAIEPSADSVCCFNCAHFHDDPEDGLGYCCNINAPLSSREYGGHWSSRYAKCDQFQRGKMLAVPSPQEPKEP